MHDESSGIQQEGRKLQVTKEDGSCEAECCESKSGKTRKKKIEPGDAFGRWVVVSFSHSRKTPCGTILRYWNCKCICGTEKSVIGYALKAGESLSCGCLQREKVKDNKTHGLSRSSEYIAWACMKDRCNNPKSSRFHRYGGRGIRVSDRWMNSFQEFFNDMGPRPSKEHSIDRINNDGDYEPENCRWATKSDQYNNRSTNVRVELNGRSFTITQLSKKYGLSPKTIHYRIFKLKWSIEKSVTEPSRKSKKCLPA